jgi:hypothetical protein
MALNKEEREKLDATYNLVKELKVVLLGKNSDKGLVGDFLAVAKSHWNLRRNFWILVALLFGAGILTGSLVGVFA